ncbi:MAG: hypothetical protein V5A48_14745 [Salinivenus sp.]
MPDWLVELVKLNDRRVPELLDRQIEEEGSDVHGAVVDDHQIPVPNHTASLIETLTIAHLYQHSSHHRSDRIRAALEAAADALLRFQHEDGSIDLRTTNFHSTPDTGFVVNDLAPIYALLRRHEVEALGALTEMLETFLLRAGEILKVGGVHTPNHRWVVTAALSWLHRIQPDNGYVERAEEWLREGVYVNPDGQYIEESVGIYSAIVDQTLITISRNLDRPEYLGPVRQNLDATLYYLRPGGELVTAPSSRRDRDEIRYVRPYYYAYRSLAIRDDEPRYAAVCRLIEAQWKGQLGGDLPLLCEDSSVWSGLPPAASVPMGYQRSFSHSGVHRIRSDDLDAAVIEDDPSFFSFMKGEAVLDAVRFASAFFGEGQFKSEELTRTENGFELTQELSGPYYQPLSPDDLPDEGAVSEMKQDEREESEVQKLRQEALIRQEGNGFVLEITITGTEGVPVAVEMGFRKDGELAAVDPVEDIADAYLLPEGYGEYKCEGRRITFGPGRADHHWTELRGAEPKLDLNSVYLTGYTPFTHTIEIR